MRKSIRGGMGLGDALYVQSVARHLIQRGASLRIHSAWPAVFQPLGNKAQVVPFSRSVEILAHYAPRKSKTDTTQFQDCCIQAGIREAVELKLDWPKPEIPEALRTDKPIICVQLPRSPMGRKDGFGAELLPDCGRIQQAIDVLRGRALIVQLGSGKPLHRFTGIDVDLADKTTVQGLLDVASIADGFLGYVSFFVPLAESFDRPALLVWSRKGLHSSHPYVRQITPSKVLHKPSSRAVFDDCTLKQMEEAVDALLR